MISTKIPNQTCLENSIFMPMYNTAPGFPKWFNKMTIDEILKKDIYISRVFRYSLYRSN